MPFKNFAAGEEALAADVNTYLMKQAVATFSTAAARTAAITAPVKGQVTARDDLPGRLEVWDGTAWVFNAVSQEYLFGKTVGQTINTGASSLFSFALPAAPFPGSLIVDLYTKVDTGSGTFSQNITSQVDSAGSTPAPNVGYPGYGSLTSALASLQTRAMAAWTPITRGQLVTLAVRVFNAGGAGQVNWARVDGIVRFLPSVSAF